MADAKRKADFRTMIGGQALIEGILMRGPDKQAIVVRKQNGELVVREEPLKLIKDRHPILGLPLIRGTVNFADSMVKGVSAISFSAEQMPEDEQEEPDKLDQWIENKFGWERAQKIIIGIAVVLGMCLSVGLFILLPTLLAGFLDRFATLTGVLRNLAEGALRMVIFLVYLTLCARMPEMKRMFGYHGAEHKTIHCYEKGLPLTVENVRIQPRQHPRCGTSFLFVVMIVSIAVFSFVKWSNVWVRMAMRIVLLPLVVGISYEFNRWVGRHDNIVTAILSAPGKALQNITTNEPDDSMIEVAIESLRLVIPEESGKDEW